MISNIIIPMPIHTSTGGAIDAKMSVSLFLVSFIFLILPSITILARRCLKEYKWRVQHGYSTDFEKIVMDATDNFVCCVAFILISVYIIFLLIAIIVVLATWLASII